MQIGILDWLDEKALVPYPLESGIGINSIFLDANFVQFDGFIPVLKTAVISAHTIVFTITFDTGDQLITLTDSSFTDKSEYKIYDGTRYLGRLVFGNGVNQLWAQYTAQTINYNIRFLSVLVRAIPSNSGVYSIQNKFGAITIASDEVISFAVVGNVVTFNAIGLPDDSGLNALKTINSLSPIGNNITIVDNDLLKISGSGTEVKFSLIGANLQDTLSELFTIIPTKP